MDWVRAGIANRSKFLSRCNGSDLGLRSGSASVVWSFNSLGDVDQIDQQGVNSSRTLIPVDRRLTYKISGSPLLPAQR